MPNTRPDKGDLSLLGRIGAFAQHRQYDTRETTKKARETFDEYFVDLVDRDRVLDPAERLRRVKAARKEHYTRLALKSAQARRGRKVAAVEPSTDEADRS
jgi:hypothetical protein